MNPRKIVICLPNLNVFGGTELQTLLLSQILAENQFHPIVCCYFLCSEKVVSTFEASNIEVISLNLSKINPLYFIKKLAMFLNKINPEVVHVQYVAPGLLPIIATKLSGVKGLYSTVHQPCPAKGLKPKILLHLGAFFCDAFFCVSKATEESWFGDSKIFRPSTSQKGRKHYTIYNAVNVECISGQFDISRNQHIKNSLNLCDKPVVGVVARLRREKGHILLLDAMVSVICEIPDVVLLVVGDGPDRNQLISKSHSLGIGNHVCWLGEIEPSEVYELYGIMDVVAIPSLFEGFGLSAAEAMAAGLPVVASDVGGLREVIDDGMSGFLIQPSNTEAFADALTRLLSDPKRARAMGQNGKKRVSRYFSEQKFAESMLSVYTNFSRRE